MVSNRLGKSKQSLASWVNQIEGKLAMAEQNLKQKKGAEEQKNLDKIETPKERANATITYFNEEDEFTRPCSPFEIKFVDFA